MYYDFKSAEKALDKGDRIMNYKEIKFLLNHSPRKQRPDNVLSPNKKKILMEYYLKKKK